MINKLTKNFTTSVAQLFLGLAVLTALVSSLTVATGAIAQESRSGSSEVEDLSDCCYARASAGYGVWFFDEEDNQGFPALYGDMFCPADSLNFRVGIEGRHMDLHQPNAQSSAEWIGKTTSITLIRIPFAVEYYHELSPHWSMNLGGGPDILNVANDISDTSVGMHLGGRIHYAFTANWGVSLDAGYMWGEVNSSGGDINLDQAYVLPMATYTY